MSPYAKNSLTRREKHLAMRRWVLGSSCRIGIGMVLVMLSILYVYQTTAVSSKGTTISRLERDINVLEQEVRTLEVEVAQKGSIQSVKTRLAQTDFVPVERPEYAVIGPDGLTVAQR